MKRTAFTTLLVSGALVLGTATATVADAAPTTSHTKAPTLSKLDRQYLKANDQVNLTEIRLGTWIEHHMKSYSRAYKLAVKTVHDHRVAERAVRALAKADDVKLPSTPSAAQLKAIRQVETAPRTAYRYFVVQIAGHKLAIAATRDEIAHGKNAEVVAFAKVYLPIAQSHLKMAQQDLRWWKQHHQL